MDVRENVCGKTKLAYSFFQSNASISIDTLSHKETRVAYSQNFLRISYDQTYVWIALSWCFWSGFYAQSNNIKMTVKRLQDGCKMIVRWS